MCEDEQAGLERASIEVSLDNAALAAGFERTDDGKLKCRYCNYGSRGIQRLIEHIRIHTGNAVPGKQRCTDRATCTTVPENTRRTGF